MNGVADGNNIANSYLDRDHPKRIDVCFLADADLPAQELRWCPPYGEVLANGCSSFQVRNDGCKAEIGETRSACIVDEDT